MTFSNILFPVDFSERCRAAAPFVNALVRRQKASLNLLHLVEIPPIWYCSTEASCMPDLNIPQLVDHAATRLERFALDNFRGLKPKLIADTGDPGSCIVEIAKTSGADLIMMPTRGRGRFRSALLGSATAKVLHDAECPVWTAAHAEAGTVNISADWRTVVCAIDTSDDAMRLIRCAAELQTNCGASIELVHALPVPPNTRPEMYMGREFQAFLEDSARQSIQTMQTKIGTNFRVHMEAGKVSGVIAFAARDLNADLVLIGRGVLPHVAGRLRSDVYAIIRDAPCPVLSV
jgi:nucleotide-binding universal stress UspA family protein